MAKTLILVPVLLFISIVNSYSQEIDNKLVSSKKRFSVSLGMGISLINTPSFNRYLKNEIPYSDKDSIKTFSIGLEFFGAAEYGVSKNLSVRLDYSYFIKSIRYLYSYFTYDYFYFIHQPALNLFYMVNGKHYQLKFGGGVSYHYVQLEKSISSENALIYNANGVGIKGEIIYAAELSDKLSSYISGFAFGNFSGSLKDATGSRLLSPAGEEVNLNGFGVGTRLGVSFYLNK